MLDPNYSLALVRGLLRLRDIPLSIWAGYSSVVIWTERTRCRLLHFQGGLVEFVRAITNVKSPWKAPSIISQVSPAGSKLNLESWHEKHLPDRLHLETCSLICSALTQTHAYLHLPYWSSPSFSISTRSFPSKWLRQTCTRPSFNTIIVELNPASAAHSRLHLSWPEEFLLAVSHIWSSPMSWLFSRPSLSSYAFLPAAPHAPEATNLAYALA